MSIRLFALLIAASVVFASVAARSESLGDDKSGLRLYYGVFHAHTGEGGDDGEMKFATMEGAYAFARDRAKLDFFSLSPHAHMIAAPVYAKLQKVAGAAQTADFATFFGAEWGNLGVSGHVGTYLAPAMDHTVQPAHSDQYAHMNRYFRWLAKIPDAFGVLNHPETFHFGYYYNPIGDPKIVAMEVFNGSAFERRIDMPDKPGSFEEFILPLLNRGWHVGMVANQDNHFATWGLATRTRTGVYATAKTGDAIADAIKARRTFATTDFNLAIQLTAKDGAGRDHFMGEQIFETGKVDLAVRVTHAGGKKIQQVTLYSDVVDNGAIGRAVANGSGDTLAYAANLDLGDRFFIAKAIAEDGGVIWSSPIWATKATAGQIEMNKLMILKKEQYAAAKHLELIGPTTAYGQVLQNGINYLNSLHKDVSASVYGPLLKIQGDELRRRVREIGEYLDSLPIQDARLLRKDIKKLAKEIYLTAAEKEFIEAFLKKLDADEAAPADEAALLKEADALVKALNFDGAILIYDLLIEKFPASADATRMKLVAVYGMVEAFETALTIGEQIASHPGLDPAMGFEAYTAVALSYKRQFDNALKPDRPKFLTLSINQYLQLLKDYPDQTPERNVKTFTSLGDRYEKFMELSAEADQEKYYASAIQYYNKALKLTTTFSGQIALNEKISAATFAFESTLENYQKAVERFKALLASQPDAPEMKELHKNIADLYLQCAAKCGAAHAAERDKFLNLALASYNTYLTVAPPRDKADTHYQMGKLHQTMKQYDKALAFFLMVEKDNWRSTKLEYALFAAAQCLQKSGKPADAATIARRLLDKFPNFNLCIENQKGEQVADPAESIVGRALATFESGQPALDETGEAADPGPAKGIRATHLEDDAKRPRCDCGGDE